MSDAAPRSNLLQSSLHVGIVNNSGAAKPLGGQLSTSIDSLE
jgi:hypothetical protein